MTPGLRLRFEHMTDATRPRRFDLTPTVEDIRILLKEIDRLQFALDTAVQTAADHAFAKSVERRES